MGWFTSQYKEDALKWRAQQKELDQREIDRKYKMTVEIVLMDGDTKTAEYVMGGRYRDIGFLDTVFVVASGKSRLERRYLDIKEEAGKVGIETSDGMFIPHSNIHHIRNAGIEEIE